jgi:hypothetical protein
LRAIRHAPLSHQLWPTTSTSVQRRFSPALQSEFRGILLDILGVAGRRWSGSLFPLTPEYIAAGDVWITTGTDGQIAGFVGAGTPRCAGHTGLEQACSSIRRRHRPCAAPRSDEARQRGADRLTILWLTRNATRFYERNNGARIGGSPSDAGAPPPAPAG